MANEVKQSQGLDFNNQVSIKNLPNAVNPGDGVPFGQLGDLALLNNVIYSKEAIKNNSNLFVDPYFEDVQHWGSMSVVDTGDFGTPRFLKITGGAGLFAGYPISKLFQVTPGEKYLLTVTGKIVGTTGNAVVHIKTYSDRTTAIGDFQFNSAASSPVVTTSTFIITIPANANFAALRFFKSNAGDATEAHYSNVRFERMVGHLIEDNSLLTSKFANNSVTTPKISDNAVTTPKLLDENVTLAKLAPDARTAISGVTFTSNSDIWTEFKALCETTENVYVPSGTYTLVVPSGASITPTANLRLRGDGIGKTIINVTSAAALNLFRFNNDNVKFSDIEFRVTSVPLSSTGVFFRWANDGLTLQRVKLDGGVFDNAGTRSHGQHAISPNTSTGASNLVVDDCIITKCAFGYFRANADLGAVDHVTFKNTKFIENFAQDISINSVNDPTTDVLIHENYFANKTDLGGSNYGHNVSITGASEARVTENYIDNDFDDAVHVEENTYEIVISNNNIRTPKNGIAIKDAGNGGTVLIPSRLIINNNTLLSEAADTSDSDNRGIRLVFDASGAIAAQNIVIVGNTFKGFYRGIDLGDAAELTTLCHSNLIRDCATGIYTRYPAPEIKNNVIVNCVTGIETTDAGMMSVNTFEDVSTFVSTSSEEVALIGWDMRKDSLSLPAGLNNYTLAKAGWRLMGRLVVTLGTTNSNRRVASYILNFDGGTLTRTLEYQMGAGAISLSGNQIDIVNGDLVVLLNNTTGSTISNGRIQASFRGFQVIAPGEASLLGGYSFSSIPGLPTPSAAQVATATLPAGWTASDVAVYTTDSGSTKTPNHSASGGSYSKNRTFHLQKSSGHIQRTATATTLNAEDSGLPSDRTAQWDFLADDVLWYQPTGATYELRKITMNANGTIASNVSVFTMADFNTEYGLSATKMYVGGPGEGIMVGGPQIGNNKQFATVHAYNGQTCYIAAYNITDDVWCQAIQTATVQSGYDEFDFAGMSELGDSFAIKSRPQSTTFAVDYHFYPISVNGVGPVVYAQDEDDIVGHSWGAVAVINGTPTSIWMSPYGSTMRVFRMDTGAKACPDYTVAGDWGDYGHGGMIKYTDWAYLTGAGGVCTAFRWDGSVGCALGDGGFIDTDTTLSTLSISGIDPDNTSAPVKVDYTHPDDTLRERTFSN